MKGYGWRSLIVRSNFKEAKMADFVPKPNTGRVWPNKFRKDNDKAPHYKGNAMIDGLGMRDIAMWVNYVDGSNIVKDVAIKITEYTPRDGAQKPAQRASTQAISDEVPF
jgi:hypothetical protein